MTESTMTLVISAPSEYLTQSGVVDVGGDGLSGGDFGSAGEGGASGGETGSSDDPGLGSVVKVPTVLQALWVSEVTALTFQ